MRAVMKHLVHNISGRETGPFNEFIWHAVAMVSAIDYCAGFGKRLGLKGLLRTWELLVAPSEGNGRGVLRCCFPCPVV